MKLFGREPALVLGVVSAALSLLVSSGGMDKEMAVALIAAITGAFQAIAAWATRPIAPAVFTGLVTVAADLLAAFHYDLSTEVVAGLNGFALAVLMFITRGQVTPQPAAKPSIPTGS